MKADGVGEMEARASADDVESRLDRRRGWSGERSSRPDRHGVGHHQFIRRFALLAQLAGH